jgi:Protein of unknown function (DUF2975)
MFENVIRLLQLLKISTWIVIGLSVLALVMVFAGGDQLLLDMVERYEVRSEVTTIKYVAASYILVLLSGGAVALYILRKLTEIVRTSVEEHPFLVLNAGRLREIGWALIALQAAISGSCIAAYIVSDMTIDRLLLNLFQSVQAIGLLAAILMFVLAQMFRHGATMRQELEGTI